VHLPHSYFPTDLVRDIPPAPGKAEMGLGEDAFVFCAFNNNWKFTRPVFEVWMRLLRSVPQSLLWLKQPPPDARVNLEREAAACGVDPVRLVYAGDVPRPVHLARHGLADLFLDTLPYNAHATAADALGAGLPVLTCKGEAFAGRVAASLLNAVDLPELISENLADYEARALELARDAPKLSALKQKLERNLSSAPLFDADGFRRAIEEAFVRMHGSAQSGN
jgi:predicted O-linked N-acetylglucosamine transferase (SPINDLY family)